jgi:hypothetical protein
MILLFPIHNLLKLSEDSPLEKRSLEKSIMNLKKEGASKDITSILFLSVATLH